MKRYLIQYLALFSICSLFFFGCKKDEADHPEIQTLELTALSPTKVLLKGNIVKKGSFSNSDHGFIYSSNTYTEVEMWTKVSLGSSVSEGAFSKEIQGLLLSNGSNTLYSRVYITNTNGTVYGQINSVQLPVIGASSIVPANGKAGDQITINGQFYTLSKDEFTVTFGGVPAKINEVTPSKVIVEVPTGINTSNSNYNQISVNLNVGGKTINVPYNFKLIPNLKTFSPTSGTIGTTVTITGDNIPNYYYSGTVKVFFGSIQSTSTSYSSSGITAVVPSNITDLSLPVSVEFDGIKINLGSQFTVTPHTISSINPASGLPGSSFSVFGSNFPSNGYYNTAASVTIGGIPASASYVSSGQLNVTIPNNLPAGDYKVAVKAGPFSVEATQTLKVQALAVTSFSPSSGSAGKEVTLQGTFAPNQSYQVYFGSTYTSATSISSTSIRAPVPSGALPGNVKITVKYGSQYAEAANDFTILSPTITSFSPSSGVAGTVVTITGTGFNQYTYNNSVKFGSISANVTSASESSLTVAVPSNISPGAMKITIVSNGQTAVSSANFTVN